jgi:hypothetical protein
MKKKETKAKAPVRKIRVPTSPAAFVELADAIVGGEVAIPVGSGVAFVRTGAIHRGWIHSVTATARGKIVDVWDEVEDQFFSFNLSEEPLPDVKDTGDRHRVKVSPAVVRSSHHEEEAQAPEPGGGGGDASTPEVEPHEGPADEASV